MCGYDTFCGASKTNSHIGITLFIVCLSVCYALLLQMPHAFLYYLVVM